MSKSEAKHAKREPKGPKSEPKEIQKGAEWSQKNVPGAPVGHFWVPLGDEMSSRGQPGTAWAAKLAFTQKNLYFRHAFWSVFDAVFH